MNLAFKINKFVLFILTIAVFSAVVFYFIHSPIEEAKAQYSSCGEGCWQAVSCSHLDVIAAISNASAGDTIMVPAGECTWPANAVTIPVDKPLIIMGAGRDKLTINLDGSYGFTIKEYIGKGYPNGGALPATRITGFKFVSPLMAKYTAILAKGRGWRIDNCAYESIEDTTSQTAGPFVLATGLNTGIPGITPYGLVDNNIVINGKVLAAGAGNPEGQTLAWSNALALGTDQAVYVENNNFSTSIETNLYKRLVVDSNYGGRYVFRYNTVLHGDNLIHGLQAENTRATRKWEIYGNRFNSLNAYTWGAIGIKAGTGVVFNNDITSVYPYDQSVVLSHERSTRSIGYYGICDGTSSYDGNLDATGWPCRDQLGTGGDEYTWQTPFSSNTPPNQILMPAYIWGILEAGVAIPPYIYAGSENHIKINRDYYVDNASCTDANCASGVGCGSSTPTGTCTAGVAYWLTNQSCTDLTGLVGANPGTPIDGVLYKCTSTDNWEPYYTPYIYPHPLTLGVTNICGEGEITSECWCEGYQANGSCDNGYYTSTNQDCSPLDLDCSGDVNLDDLTQLKTLWGQSGKADLNQDNITNVSDFGIMMSTWGN